MENQWNEPGLTEHYLMLIVDSIRHVLATGTREIDLAPCKLKFERQFTMPEQTVEGEETQEELERRTAEARRILIARFGKIKGLDSQGNPT